jgi:hypothetical protein
MVLKPLNLIMPNLGLLAGMQEMGANLSHGTDAAIRAGSAFSAHPATSGLIWNPQQHAAPLVSTLHYKPERMRPTWRPAISSRTPAEKHRRFQLTPFEEQTRKMVRDVTGIWSLPIYDNLITDRNGRLVRKHLQDIRSIAKRLRERGENESGVQAFLAFGLGEAMHLLERYGIHPFLKILDANPERAWVIVSQLGRMENLVKRIGIGPFVLVATRYRHAEQIISEIQDDGVLVKESLQHKVHSASDLLLLARQIEAFYDRATHDFKTGNGSNVRMEYLVRKYGAENLPSIARIAQAMGPNAFMWGNGSMEIERLFEECKGMIERCGYALFADLCEMTSRSLLISLEKNIDGFSKTYSGKDDVRKAAALLWRMAHPKPASTALPWNSSGEFRNATRIPHHVLIDGLFGREETQTLVDRLGLESFEDLFAQYDRNPSKGFFQSLAVASHLIKTPQDLISVSTVVDNLPDKGRKALAAYRHLIGNEEDLSTICAMFRSQDETSLSMLTSFSGLVHSFQELRQGIDLIARHPYVNTSTSPKASWQQSLHIALMRMPHLLHSVEDLDTVSETIFSSASALSAIAASESQTGETRLLGFLMDHGNALAPAILTRNHLEQACKAFSGEARANAAFLNALPAFFPFIHHLLTGPQDIALLFELLGRRANAESDATAPMLGAVHRSIGTMKELDAFFQTARGIARACRCEKPEILKALFSAISQQCTTLTQMQYWLGIAETLEDVVWERAFLIRMGDTIHLEHLSRALKIFRSVLKEVGIVPARKDKAFTLLKAGLQRWDGRDEEGIPDFFLLQALAVAADKRSLAAMKKLLASKKMRNSRDDRKVVMWFLEDRRHDRHAMEQFHRVIDISSSKGMTRDIRTLGTLLLIDPRFTLQNAHDSASFQEKARETIRDFISQKTQDERVRTRFVEHVAELHQSGMLQAIVAMYSKYARSPRAELLLNIALAAIAMDDFEKVKFPTDEGIERMTYLTGAQKDALRKAKNQLTMLRPDQRTAWMADTERNVDLDGFANSTDHAKADIAQRIKDLKFHFEQHLHAQQGAVEKTFAFSDVSLARIEEELATCDPSSRDARRLQHIKHIITTVRAIEAFDPSHVKEDDESIQQKLQALAQETKALFTECYDWDEETLASLQAKMDIELLRKMLLGNLERHSLTSLSASDSADARHLMLAGKEPENSGSCQRYDGEPGLMIGLLGYLLNSAVKIIRVKNQDGAIVGRAMLRIVEGDGKPMLLLERAYYRNSQGDASIDDSIVKLAQEKAQAMGLLLITRWRNTGRQRTMKILKQEGLSPYEYSDGLIGNNGLGGVLHGKVEQELEVSIIGNDDMTEPAHQQPKEHAGHPASISISP